MQKQEEPSQDSEEPKLIDTNEELLKEDPP
jgi:hypothetical protein